LRRRAVMSGGALFVAVFVACVVEAVEALTIVLAAGTGRDWRSAITGVAAGVVVLALMVAVLGPAVTAIPLGGLRLVVGGLLLIFGLQWLRKASGLKALPDEDAIYAAELAAAQAAHVGRRGMVADCSGGGTVVARCPRMRSSGARLPSTPSCEEGSRAAGGWPRGQGAKPVRLRS
jgi:hypothetical protein